MQQINSLDQLYVQKLQMIYDAERQTLEAFPRLTQMVQNDDLRTGMEAHRQQTEDQARQVEQLVRARDGQTQGMTCLSMRALIQEAEQTLPSIQDPDTRDAFIIAAQQAVEHHEMAAYGTARTWAQELGYDDDAAMLQSILDQEGSTDKLLSDVAERRVNPQASSGGSDVDVTPRAQMGDRSMGGTGTSAGLGNDARGDQGIADAQSDA
jgi:ferritin-like metal-binding protein YciE